MFEFAAGCVGGIWCWVRIGCWGWPAIGIMPGIWGTPAIIGRICCCGGIPCCKVGIKNFIKYFEWTRKIATYFDYYLHRPSPHPAWLAIKKYVQKIVQASISETNPQPPNNNNENHKKIIINGLTCGKYAKGMLCGYKLWIVLGAGATVMPLA